MKMQKFLSRKLGLAVSFIGLLTFAACDENKFEDITGDDDDKTVTKEKSLKKFDQLKAEDYADVNLNSASDHKAKIKADSDIIDKVNLNVKGDQLVINIDDDSKLFNNDDVTVHVYAPKINRVQSKGSGNIKSPAKVTAKQMNWVVEGSGDADIWANESTNLTIQMNGSGDVTVKGPAEKVDLESDGSGDFTANNLASEIIEIYSKGSGDVTLTGNTEKLDITTEGSGDVKAPGLHTKEAGLSTVGSGNIKVTVKETLRARTAGSGDIEYYGDPEIKTHDEDGSGDIEKAN